MKEGDGILGSGMKGVNLAPPCLSGFSFDTANWPRHLKDGMAPTIFSYTWRAHPVFPGRYHPTGSFSASKDVKYKMY